MIRIRLAKRVRELEEIVAADSARIAELEETVAKLLPPSVCVALGGVIEVDALVERRASVTVALAGKIEVWV